MLTSQGIAQRPFLVTVAPRICDCKLSGKELLRTKSADKAIREVGGYWNVYVGFFGDQTMWLDFLVTDLRDGSIVWRNGRRLKEERDAPEAKAGTIAGTAGGITSRDPWLD